MLVRVLVDTPSTLNTRQKELIEELSHFDEETPLVKSYNDKLQTILRARK